MDEVTAAVGPEGPTRRLSRNGKPLGRPPGAKNRPKLPPEPLRITRLIDPEEATALRRLTRRNSAGGFRTQAYTKGVGLPPGRERKRTAAGHKGHVPTSTKIMGVVAAEMTSIDAAAKAIDVSARSLRVWRSMPEFQQYVDFTREQMVGELTAVAVMAWSRLMVRLLEDRIESRDLVILAGVATDKMQLLSGGATSRLEKRSIPDILNDHETSQIIAAARRHLAGDRARQGQSVPALDALEVPAPPEPDAP